MILVQTAEVSTMSRCVPQSCDFRESFSYPLTFTSSVTCEGWCLINGQISALWHFLSFLVNSYPYGQNLLHISLFTVSNVATRKQKDIILRCSVTKVIWQRIHRCAIVLHRPIIEYTTLLVQ